jgi:Tfp pilus assembly protein PilO
VITRLGDRLTRWQIDAGAFVACVLLTAIGYVLIYRPIIDRQSDLARLRVEVATTRTQTATAESARAALDRELGRIRAQLAESPVHLEPVERLNRRIARIVELATASRMVINETRAGTVAEGERYRTVPVKISGSGSYSQCAVFLHRLAADLPDVEVLGFELAGNPGVPTARSSFRFDLAWYATPSVASAEEHP